MKPGQQAIVLGNDIKLVAIDPEKGTAWLSDYFEECNSDYLLRQIGRWHDLEIVYEGKSRIIEFEGDLSRSIF